MRRLYTLLLALVATVAMSAQSQDNALFVYRNDGNFNAFLREEIDSITLSCYDLDSLIHNEVVCQVFHTADSVYRIPIADIDSVSFVAPPTKAHDNSIDLALSHSPYIVGVDYSDGICLLLLPSIPGHLIPQPGMCLYQENSTESLPMGFAAKVVSVEQGNEAIVVKCEDVELSEVFEQVAWIKRLELTATDNEIRSGEPEAAIARAATRATAEGNDKPNVESLAWFAAYRDYPHNASAVFFDKELQDISLGPKDPKIRNKIAVQPNLAIAYCEYIVDVPQSGVKTHFSGFHTKIMSNVEIEIRGRHNVEKTDSIDKEFEPVKMELPIGYGRKCVLNFSAKLKLDGKMGLDYKYKGQFIDDIVTKVAYMPNGEYAVEETSVHHKERSKPTQELDASFKGSLTLTASLSLVLQRNVDSLKVDSLKSISHVATYGTSLKGNALYLNSEIGDAASNNSLYKRITKTGVTAQPLVSLSAVAKYGKVSLKPAKAKVQIAQPKAETFYAVPKLSSPVFDADNSSFTYKVEGTPMKSASAKLGLAMKSKDSMSWMETGKVWPTNCKESFAPTLNTSLSNGDIIYPTVTMPKENSGLSAPPDERIIAAPELKFEVTTDDASDVTSKSATLSAKADSTFITCKSNMVFGFCLGTSSNIDISNSKVLEASNVTSFTVSATELQEKTKYYYCAYAKGNKTIIYGDVKSFTTKAKPLFCPDDNHPHVIDLGLPSGTKWACCNHGAKSPEERGDFYGGPLVYEYFPEIWKDWIQAGKDEFDELYYNCSFSRFNYPHSNTADETGKNYTEGWVFKGPNGNQIFIPNDFYWTSEVAGYTYGYVDTGYTIYVYYPSQDGCYMFDYGRTSVGFMVPLRLVLKDR